MTETTLPELLTLESATRAYNVTRRALVRAIERGELSAETIQSGARRVQLLRRADVAAWREGRP